MDKIEEARQFALEFIEMRNKEFGKVWVDNVTDSWIYDSEDYWLTRYFKKYGDGVYPSQEESDAHWSESFRLFKKQYAELFGERDSKIYVDDLLKSIMEKADKYKSEISEMYVYNDSAEILECEKIIQDIWKEAKAKLAKYQLKK